MTRVKKPVAPKLSAFDLVRAQARKAYTDCWSKMAWPKVEKIRDLDWCAKVAVSRDEAVKIMAACVGPGYNEFQGDLLAKLPADARVFLAREGSVAVYVEGRLPDEEKLQADLKADEFQYEAGTDRTRIWWD